MKIYRENNAIVFDDEAGFITQVDPALLLVKISGDNYTFYRTTINPLFEPISIGDIKNKLGVAYTTNSFNLFLGTNGLVTSVDTIDAYTKTETNALLAQKQNLIVNRVYVSQESDFGTIQSGKEYFVTGIVTLTSPIVIPTGASFRINGYGTDISQLVSTANNFTMIIGSVTGNLMLSNVAFEASGTNSKVFDIKSQTGFESCEKDTVNFNNCNKIGVFDSYRQMLGVNMGYLGGKPEYEFKGAMQGFRISTSIIRNTVSGYTFWKAGTGFSFTGRFITDINAIIPSGSTFCDFNSTHITNDESLQFISADFNPASTLGTVLSGITPTSTKVRVSRSRGLANTYIGGYWSCTTAVTTALTGGTIAKVAGTTTYSDLSWFTSSGNNAFVSQSTKDIVVEAIFNGGFTGIANNEYTLTIRHWDNSASAYINISSVTFTTNGGLLTDSVESLSLISKNITLMQNDRVELWVQDANSGGNDIVMNVNSIFKLREVQS